MVFARLDGNPEVRAQESSAKLGHELATRVPRGAHLPGGAGDALHNLVNGWNQTNPERNDFAPINLGQLKQVKDLYLAHNGVTDVGVKQLGKMTQLTRLGLLQKAGQDRTNLTWISEATPTKPSC